MLKASLAGFHEVYHRIFPGKRMKTVTFIVTHGCNLRCSYCYEHNKSDARMTFETAQKAVDTLFRSDAENGVWVNPDDADGLILEFIGGEPLLEVELIDRVMDYFLARAVELRHRWATRYMINISTNGVLYDSPEVQRFLTKWRGRLSVGVTVDGDKATHDACRVDEQGRGSFDKASAAFRDIIRRHGMSGTKLTIAPGNVDKVFSSHKYMIEEYGVTQLMSNCVYEEGWNLNHATELYRQLKALADWLIETEYSEKVYLSIFSDAIGRRMPDEETQNWCGGTGKMLAFDTDGEILPCMRYSNLSLGSNREPMIVGHVDTGLAATDEQRAVIDMLEDITRQSQSTPECISCPIASGCAWCSAYNYEVYGTPDKRATFICPMHKARVLATAYYCNSSAHGTFPLNIPREWALEIVSEPEFDTLAEMAREAG
jgi:uncharacterized protein